MERIIPEIYLEGKDFSPTKLSSSFKNARIREASEKGDVNRFGRNVSFGSCIITSEDIYDNDRAIQYIMDLYDSIVKFGMKNLEIEKSIFNLYVEDVRQSNFTVSTKILSQIVMKFEEINFIVLEPEQ